MIILFPLVLFLVTGATDRPVVTHGVGEEFDSKLPFHKDSADQKLIDCLVAPSAELLIFIQSQRHNFHHRQAIRSSWGNSSLFPRQQVCVFFVIPSESALVQHERQCNRTFSQFDSEENSPHCPCSNMSSLELLARRCNEGNQNTTNKCHSLKCTGLLHQLTHCGILSEQSVHADVLLLPAVERGKNPRLGLQRTLTLLRRRMQVFLGRTTANGADMLITTDSSVVNVPHLISKVPRLLPLKNGRMLKRFASSSYAAAGETDRLRVLRLHKFNLMLFSQPCVSEFSSKDDNAASQPAAKCQVVSVPDEATVPFCSATQIFATFSATSGKTSHQIEECWKKIRQESDADHQSRSLVPKFSALAVGSRRRSIVTVVAIASDPFSLLARQLLSQLRHQSLQPRVHLVLVVPTPLNGQHRNLSRLHLLLETYGVSEWVSVLAVKPGESLGAQRNMAIREAAEWSIYITVWALEDFHSPGLLARQVQHVQQHFLNAHSDGKYTSSQRQHQGASTNAVYLVCSASVERSVPKSRGTLLVTDLDVVAPLFTADLSRYCTYPDADVAIDASHITCATLRGFQVLSASCQLDVVHHAQSPEYEAAFRKADTLPATEQRDYMLGLSEAKLLKESSIGNQFLRRAMVPRLHVHRSDGPNKVLSMPGITENVLLFPVVRHLAHFQRRPQVSVVVAWQGGGRAHPVGWRRDLVRFFERDSWKGQLQLVFCGSGSMDDMEVRMQLLAEWQCNFCDYAHVPKRGSVPLGTVIQRGVDLARSNYVVVLHVPHIPTSSSETQGSSDAASASHGTQTLASVLTAWKFSLEDFLTRIFHANADLIILHGANTPNHPQTRDNLEWMWVVLGFVREAGQICTFVASDWDCINLFRQCVQASGLRTYVQWRALSRGVQESLDQPLTHGRGLLSKLEAMVRLKLPQCEKKFAFNSHTIDVACKDGALALGARLHLDRSMFLPTIILFAGSEGTNIRSLSRNLREFLSAGTQPDIVEVHLHSDPLCREGNNGIRSSSSRNNKPTGFVETRTVCVHAKSSPACDGATTDEECSVHQLNLASIADSRWMLEWYFSGRNYSDHYISRVVQHFQQDDAEVVVCRCWKENPPHTEEQCARSAGHYQIVAYARKVLELCPYPYVLNEAPNRAEYEMRFTYGILCLSRTFKMTWRHCV